MHAVKANKNMSHIEKYDKSITTMWDNFLGNGTMSIVLCDDCQYFLWFIYTSFM